MEGRNRAYSPSTRRICVDGHLYLSKVYFLCGRTGVEVEVDDASETWEFCLLILQFISLANSVRIALMWNHYIRISVYYICVSPFEFGTCV
jgi:hypothetical protein